MGRRDAVPASGDRKQSMLALRAAADKFTRMLSDAIAEHHQGQLIFRVKVDRGKAKEIQLNVTTDEPIDGFEE